MQSVVQNWYKKHLRPRVSQSNIKIFSDDFFLSDHWRMIMAPGDFVVTPACYNRQFEERFRMQEAKMTYEQLERTRRRVKKWMAENSQHFTL